MSFQSLDSVVVGQGDGPVVVFLHGFGAPGDDLVPLAEMLTGVLDGVRFVCPAAPMDLGRAMGYGRAWWMIDMARIERSIMSGEVYDLSKETPVGLAAARDKLVALLAEIDDKLRPPKLVLGGFSQGAMLSMDTALRTDRALAGLTLLSGTLVAEAEWRPLLPKRAGLRVFQSHGELDQILPFAAAERLRKLMVESGLDVDWVPFGGAHEIPMPVLQRLARFLGHALA